MIPRNDETFEPVTLGHIRGHGCRDLLAYCGSDLRVAAIGRLALLKWGKKLVGERLMDHFLQEAGAVVARVWLGILTLILLLGFQVGGFVASLALGLAAAWFVGGGVSDLTSHRSIGV
jgi:hypothetical protein